MYIEIKLKRHKKLQILYDDDRIIKPLFKLS